MGPLTVGYVDLFRVVPYFSYGDLYGLLDFIMFYHLQLGVVDIKGQT